ncbi:unnamed protein product [Trichogramma brassicae]|uniref:Uncharacterized protein n=1 Tax=Trichogramma brassicae TaxID=86971 RepID=A0A6H5I758_9HYME|nr:unnamed protein product [Trichogramma brassicae]
MLYARSNWIRTRARMLRAARSDVFCEFACPLRTALNIEKRVHVAAAAQCIAAIVLYAEGRVHSRNAAHPRARTMPADDIYLPMQTLYNAQALIAAFRHWPELLISIQYVIMQRVSLASSLYICSGRHAPSGWNFTPDRSPAYTHNPERAGLFTKFSILRTKSDDIRLLITCKRSVYSVRITDGNTLDEFLYSIIYIIMLDALRAKSSPQKYGSCYLRKCLNSCSIVQGGSCDKQVTRYSSMHESLLYRAALLLLQQLSLQRDGDNVDDKISSTTQSRTGILLFNVYSVYNAGYVILLYIDLNGGIEIVFGYLILSACKKLLAGGGENGVLRPTYVVARTFPVECSHTGAAPAAMGSSARDVAQPLARAPSNAPTIYMRSHTICRPV